MPVKFSQIGPLFLIITQLRAILATAVCIKPQISLTQKIDHEGFHREFHWLLERNPDPNWAPDCHLALKLAVPKEMYVSPDQISELNRMGLLSALIVGQVDVEAAAHVATEHAVYVYVADTTEKVLIDLPFHLRYQRAQISGRFGKIVLNKPEVLVRCPHECEGKEKKVVAPCDASGAARCAWKNVTYQALFDEVELLVPVGDLDDYPLVSMVTLLLGCAGCIYTLSVLSTTPL